MNRITYHHGNLRDELVRCGKEILQSEGISSLTLRSITRAAGVSHGAPRNEFADMNGLLAAIATSGFEDLIAARQAALQKVKGGADDRLRSVLATYITFARDQPGLFALMYGHHILERASYPELNDVSERSYELLQAKVYDYLVSSGFPAACTDELVQCTWSAVHGVSMLFSNRPSGPNVKAVLPFDRWRSEVIAFTLAGLLARAKDFATSRSRA